MNKVDVNKLAPSRKMCVRNRKTCSQSQNVCQKTQNLLTVEEQGGKPLGTSLHAIFVMKLLNAPLTRQTKIECFSPLPLSFAPFCNLRRFDYDY